ncbi:hypothetical protein [Cohaesibacter marisflavi]|uniref:hypothetical protein n=1 Tax=Cohaesibacter marisflavi TaxID=655353 RepID=UPI000B7D87A9|nr:hypothetical protein [Cohaesibacter marisflavi]
MSSVIGLFFVYGLCILCFKVYPYGNEQTIWPSPFRKVMIIVYFLKGESLACFATLDHGFLKPPAAPPEGWCGTLPAPSLLKTTCL